MDLDCRARGKKASFEIRCFRRLLNIPYKDHVTNEEVRRKTQAAIEDYDELLIFVKKGMLRWFGHISKVFLFSKENPTGHSERKKEKRQTEEKVGR